MLTSGPSVAAVFCLLFSTWNWVSEPFSSWSLKEAVTILNDSPWARQTTFARAVGGVGSGVAGEKEVFDTFYVRFLSALPVRQALVRIEQVDNGYDGLSPEDKARFDALAAPGLDLDFDDWLVLTLSFRSNDPAREREVERFLRASTVDSLRTTTSLSTVDHSQVSLAGYFQPAGDGLGAKLVFPRRVKGVDLITSRTPWVILEMRIPNADPVLTVQFDVEEMLSDDGPML